MSTKTLERLKGNNTELRYATYVKQMVDLIGPKHLRLVAGRGMTKTTDVIADRSQEVIYDMPRSLQAFVSDTFVNARTNIVPTLLEGWREYKGWIEGTHFVVDERPPSTFDIPYKPITSFKNTISLFNGCAILLGSLDQPSGLAGNSFQHIYGDEAKYLNKDKLNVLMPALRGYNKFMHSPFYRGTTFTTDLPNISKNDFDWILDSEKEMDVERVKAALYAGLVLNEINIKLKRAIDLRNKAEIAKQMRLRKKWYVKWYRARYDTTFFYIVSSLANVDILTAGYIYDNLENLGWEEFKQSILSFKSVLEEGERFYVGLGEHHFYDDGILNDYVMKYGIKDDFVESSLMLKYVDPKQPLDCGIDFGKMISMVVAQEKGNYLYCLKNFFTLVPESSKELGAAFVKFFEPHDCKVLNMYYDRSGNQYESSGRDWASEIKKHIEYDDLGRSTDWKVNLMSREQATIYQSEEYMFMKQVLQQTNTGVPGVRIDRYQCKQLKSSLELAKVTIRKDSKTAKTGIYKNGPNIHKNKKSESLPLFKLPMQSTNFSDAFKYLLYRRHWAKNVKYKPQSLPTGIEGTS